MQMVRVSMAFHMLLGACSKREGRFPYQVARTAPFGHGWERLEDSGTPHTALPDLFGSESVDRRSGRFYQRKININLTAMMDFVLHHGAQPLPHGDGSAVGSGAAALKIFRREAGEYFARLAMQTLRERDD